MITRYFAVLKNGHEECAIFPAEYGYTGVYLFAESTARGALRAQPRVPQCL